MDVRVGRSVRPFHERFVEGEVAILGLRVQDVFQLDGTWGDWGRYPLLPTGESACAVGSGSSPGPELPVHA